jgi:hypothetical protein
MASTMDEYLFDYHGRKGFVCVDYNFFSKLYLTEDHAFSMEGLEAAFSGCTIFSTMLFDFRDLVNGFGIGRLLKAVKLNRHVRNLSVWFGDRIQDFEILQDVLQQNKTIRKLKILTPRPMPEIVAKLIPVDTGIVKFVNMTHMAEVPDFNVFVDLINLNSNIRVLIPYLSVQPSDELRRIDAAICQNPNLEEIDYVHVSKESKKHMKNNKRRRQKLERCIINRLTPVSDMNRLIAEYLRV